MGFWTVAQWKAFLLRIAFRPDSFASQAFFWDLAGDTAREAYAHRHAPLPGWIDRLAGLAVVREADGVTVHLHTLRRRHLGPGESFPQRGPYDEHADLWPCVIHTDPVTGAVSHRHSGEDDEVTLFQAFVNRKLEIRWDIDTDPATLDPDELGWRPPEAP